MCAIPTGCARERACALTHHNERDPRVAHDERQHQEDADQDGDERRRQVRAQRDVLLEKRERYAAGEVRQSARAEVVTDRAHLAYDVDDLLRVAQTVQIERRLRVHERLRLGN